MLRRILSTLGRPQTVWPLLGVSAVLWVLVTLALLKVSLLYMHVERVTGPLLTRGAMVLFPLIALIAGLRMVRSGAARKTGWLGAAGGVIFLTAFAVVIGRPMIVKAMSPPRPANPSTPRPLAVETGIPVFPGAEGFGTRTPAGRGGKVYAVTSLADEGPGTLREALESTGPVTIVFRVSGTIELQSPLFISRPYVTIAGQTAPGDGICLKNAGLIITTHDVLVQYLRIRPGNEGNIPPDDNDGICILGAHGNLKGGAHHVVIDHVSVSWSEDEAVSTWFGPHDITLSWCIVSEALNRSRHVKGTHSAGVLIGDSSEHVSMHHSLLAHNSFRNPLISSGGTHEIVNNVVYDWKEIPGEIYDLQSNTFINFIGNTFIAGPSVANQGREVLINPGKDKGVPKLYVRDNAGPNRTTPEAGDWETVGYGWSGVRAEDKYRAADAFMTRGIMASPSAKAFDEVLARAGASLRRDAVDERIVQEVRDHKGRIIDSPNEVGGYPRLRGKAAPADTDGDGMPDDWEKASGLDQNNPADGSADRNGDGYTNLEEYLHSLQK